MLGKYKKGPNGAEFVWLDNATKEKRIADKGFRRRDEEFHRYEPTGAPFRLDRRIASQKEYLTGFTLLELLIVITILVILAAAVVFILNPAETLKKSRDAQRINDLTTIKNTLGLYLTSTSTPYLAGASSNAGCKDAATYGSGDKIYYSLPSDGFGGSITDSVLDGGAASIPAAVQSTTADLRKVDGNGWIPVNLSLLIGGSPISHFPVDPVNTIGNLGGVASTDLVYRYACDIRDTTFEMNANLESATYTSGLENRENGDGGNNNNLFEVGSKLDILGIGNDF